MEKVGLAVTKVVSGDHVVVSFGYCGQCEPCRNHRPSYCELFNTTANMKVLKDGMAMLAKNEFCGFVGGAPKGMEVTVDVEHMMTGGRALRGIILGDCDPDAFIPKMVDLFKLGRFPIDNIISQPIRLPPSTRPYMMPKPERRSRPY